MNEEFIINEHRITFYEIMVEIEEFKDENFTSRVIISHEDFKKLIKRYNRWIEKWKK